MTKSKASPPSPQPKHFQKPSWGRTFSDGVFSSWKGHRPFSEPPPALRRVTCSPTTSARSTRSRTSATSSSRMRPATAGESTGRNARRRRAAGGGCGGGGSEQGGQLDAGVGELVGVDLGAFPHQPLDHLALVPDVDVHAGDDAVVLEPEREELPHRLVVFALVLATDDHPVVAVR